MTLTPKQYEAHYARAMIAQAAARQGNPVQRGFMFTLLEWAAQARRRYAQIQPDLIEGR